jgi:anti-sigma factor RsiW
MSASEGTYMNDHLDEATINDVADDRVPAGQRARVEAHLLGCVTCRDAVDEMRQVIALGTTAEARAATPLLTVDPPSELWPVVAATTVHERLVRRHVLRAMRGTLAAAALVLVAASLAATVGVMRLAARGADNGPGPSAEAGVRGATMRQLAALANMETAELRAIESTGRRAEVERELTALDSVLAVARDAAIASPLDHELLNVVNEVYDRRLAIIRRAKR